MENLTFVSPEVPPLRQEKEIRIRVVIVDDHELMRHIIEKILSRDDDIEVVGTAEDGTEALRLINEASTDIVLMDLAMPKMDGVEVLKWLRSEAIEAAVIIVSVHAQVQTVLRAFDEGARGYVVKKAMTEELLPAVHAVFEGKTFVSESLQPLDNRGRA
ncbi:MAG: response regulator [bacterium]